MSGPADIDKLDYLLRDSHFCGVNYGRYDLDKVVESARLFDDAIANETYLAFHQDAIFALEEMLVARYHMNRQGLRAQDSNRDRSDAPEGNAAGCGGTCSRPQCLRLPKNSMKSLCGSI